MKCKPPNKRGRETLDKRLAKLAPDARMLWMIYGDKEATNPARRLAAQAQALRGLEKALGAKFEPTLSEGYNAARAELQRHAGELCAQALHDKNESFFRQLPKEMRKVESQATAPLSEHTIRLILMHEAKNGPINLSRLSSRLKEFRGLNIAAGSLGDIAHRLGIPTLPRGRPKKSGV